MLTHSALHKLRYKDSITAGHALHTSPRPSSNGSGTSAISAGSINNCNATTTPTITPNIYAFDIAQGANAQQSQPTPTPISNNYGPPCGNPYGNPYDVNTAPVMPPVADAHVPPSAPNYYEWMQPAVSAQGVLTNGTAADCAAATTAVGPNGTAVNTIATAAGASGAAAGPTSAAAPAAGAAGTRPHELAEEAEATPFKWHVKTLLGDMLVWAALFTLLWGAAMPMDDDRWVNWGRAVFAGGAGQGRAVPGGRATRH